jgi:hypothetical protein
MALSKFQVPEDFPRLQIHSAVAGAQPKLALTAYDGKLYPPGGTPPEMFSRWEVCEDLAEQFVAKSTESKLGKRAHMLEVEILEQYCVRAMKTGWGSDDEMRWVIRRAAALLGWPVPPSACFEVQPLDGNL